MGSGGRRGYIYPHTVEVRPPWIMPPQIRPPWIRPPQIRPPQICPHPQIPLVPGCIKTRDMSKA